MNKEEIRIFLDSFQQYQTRTLVIVDFGNVEKWKESLGWKIGIQELAKLVKHLTLGNKFLRRFYYGSDYGENEGSTYMKDWSYNIISRAQSNGFEVITKRVKYIHDNKFESGFDKKCDLDVEMTLDILRMKDEYDRLVIFSGDGDLSCVMKYLFNKYDKEIYVFGARSHIGREVIDGSKEGFIKKILYANDFEYRLNMDRFRYR